MKTTHFFYLAVVTLTLVFTSCKKDKPDSPAKKMSPSGYNNGVFITNEGQYGSGTGTVSFFSKDSLKVINDIFQLKNNYPLGNVVQSIELYNGVGYIVVNNAGKIETVDASTFSSKGTISGLTQPRYFTGIDANKGYVSEYGSGGVAGAIQVVNLSTRAITKTIATGKGANKMVKVGNYIYVACNGGYDTDSVVTVIDATTDAVIKNIVVGANPSEVKVDATGNVWVLCIGHWNSGYTALDKTGALVKINTTSNTVALSLPFSTIYSQPSCLVTNAIKTKLYYVNNGGIFMQDVTASSLSSNAFINRNFYGLGIDPTNDYFYAADPGNYQSNGKVIRYTYTGAVVDSFMVGVIPGNFYFK